MLHSEITSLDNRLRQKELDPIGVAHELGLIQKNLLKAGDNVELSAIPDAADDPAESASSENRKWSGSRLGMNRVNTVKTPSVIFLNNSPLMTRLTRQCSAVAGCTKFRNSLITASLFARDSAMQFIVTSEASTSSKATWKSEPFWDV